jgi:catechol 2,3-dioxygenase-like lactoylglutathione lyase family enzyme
MFYMIDHLSTYATDYAATRAFYEAVLPPLGYTLQMDFPDNNMCAFGPPKNPVFWVIAATKAATPRHIAFSASDRESVTHFYHTGLQQGGQDNGSPGLRSQYHEHYYGAFLLDPDGNNVEAVCHAPGE